MSQSLVRVRRTLDEAGQNGEILGMPGATRAAAEVATAAGSNLDQIVKAIIFRGEADGHLVLFLTAGGNRVDPAKVSALAGAPLGPADLGLPTPR